MGLNSINILYEKDEDGYFIASCPDLEGCYTQGKTLQEATENIKEVIDLCLEESTNGRGNNYEKTGKEYFNKR